MSEALDKYKELTRRHDEVMRRGLADGTDVEAELDAIADEMDGPWRDMTGDERAAAGAYSAELYDLWPPLLTYKDAVVILADVTRNATVRRANDVTLQARLDELVAHWTRERDDAWALLTDEERRSVTTPTSGP